MISADAEEEDLRGVAAVTPASAGRLSDTAAGKPAQGGGPAVGSRKVSSTASAVTDGRALRSFFIWVAAVQIQPVSGAEVATLLAHTAAFSPLFGVREIAGPDQFRLDTFLRAALNAVGEHRRVFTDDSSPYFGARLRPGDLLPGADAYIAGTHYADWLTGQLAIAEVSCRWPDH